jgi:hypothetical protein
MEIIPDKRTLIGLVEQAYEGKICLPNFQRDFVWPPDQIADLLRSLLRGYFVGSLLLLRCDRSRPLFEPSYLAGAKPHTVSPQPELLLLDGQQRLTSLIYALAAPNLNLRGTRLRRWFFVDLDKMVSDPDDDDIVVERSPRDIGALVTDPEEQFRQHLLPCTCLLKNSDYLNWRDKFEDWLRDKAPADLERFRTEWRTPWTEIVIRFQAFQVPLVELPRVDPSKPQEIGRVCAIFEKLNSSGVDLSVYDLLTARLFPSGIALHKLWNEACETHRRLAEWSGGKAETNKFGVLVLRTLALLRNLDPKPTSLIALDPTDFGRDFKRAAAALDRALEIATCLNDDGLGVFDREWLPNFGLLPVLAALRTHLEEKKLGEQPRRELRNWYWSAVFLERYSSAVESKSRRDYVDYTRYWAEGGARPLVMEEAQRVIASKDFSIRAASSNASGVYCGVFCLLAKHGARDWTLGESITLQNLEDHHIFPQKYLRDRGVTAKDEINTVVNRTLIAGPTNNKIRDRAPAAYLAWSEIFNSPPEPLLEKHFIYGGALDTMRLATRDAENETLFHLFSDFKNAREQAILSCIRDACGVSQEQPA